jgi:hypothetical protein
MGAFFHLACLRSARAATWTHLRSEYRPLGDEGNQPLSFGTGGGGRSCAFQFPSGRGCGTMGPSSVGRRRDGGFVILYDTPSWVDAFTDSEMPHSTE